MDRLQYMTKAHTGCGVVYELRKDMFELGGEWRADVGGCLDAPEVIAAGGCRIFTDGKRSWITQHICWRDFL